jgi:UDP-glucose 4-epimerase
MTEWMLRDAAAAHGLRYAALRYFNAAGADPKGRAGGSSRDATHLIKVACQTALGLRHEIPIYGEDYPTPDGTCVRDYIHVSDLAEAHVKALRHLEGGGESLTLNCGYGRGYSVRQVLRAVEEVAGRRLPVRPTARRPGDAAVITAAASRLHDRLGWAPHHANLHLIIETALAWEKRLAHGAEAARRDLG